MIWRLLRPAEQSGFFTAKMKRALRLQEISLLLATICGVNAQKRAGHSDAVAKIIHLLQSGKFDEASAPIDEYLSERAETVGSDGPLLARSMMNLANMCAGYGGYRPAESLYLRAIAIYTHTDPHGRSLLVAQIDLGVVYTDMGALDKARQYLAGVLDSHHNPPIPEFDEITGAALNGLANVARADSKYQEAAELYKRALTIAEHLFPASDPTRVVPLGNLADLYSETGDYAKAEPLFLKAISELDQLPADDPQTQRTLITNLVGLAVVYDAKGDLTRALPLANRAVAIARSSPNPYDPEIGKSLTLASILATHRHSYSEAETIAKFAVSIAEHVYSLMHPNFGVAIGNLAYIYELDGKASEAEPLNRRALDISRRALGEDSPETARALNNPGLVCQTLNKLDEAEDLFRRSIAINQKALGVTHPHLAIGYGNLSDPLWFQKRIPDALEALEHEIAIEDRNLSWIVETGSEAQKLAYTNKLRLSTDRILNFQELTEASDAARLLAAVTVLRRKARVLDALAGETDALRRGFDPSGRATFDPCCSQTRSCIGRAPPSRTVSCRLPGTTSGPAKRRRHFGSGNCKYQRFISKGHRACVLTGHSGGIRIESGAD